MRVVWKDTKFVKSDRQEAKYRGHKVFRYKNGWITDIPDDNNIYSSMEIALNALDQVLGPKNTGKIPKRTALGIKVIGKRSDAS